MCIRDRHGTVVRGFIGVEPQDISSELARTLDLPRETGAIVAGVVETGPADLAGVEVGDVVLKIDGLEVASTSKMLEIVASLKPGSSSNFEFLREGKIVNIKIKIGKRPTPRR